VEWIPRTRLDAAAVRDYGAAIVIVATGSRWATDGLNSATHDAIPGADASLPHVLTPEQLMLDGKRPPGERVLVWDCEGYFVGTGLAERLALDGHSVDLATSLHVIAPYTDETLEGPQVRQRLHEVGVRQHRGVQLVEVAPGGVRATNEFGEPFELEIDALVLVTQRLSDDALYHELVSDPDALAAEGIEAVYRIGDCVSPRIIAEAVFDGHRLAREIDADDPAGPLPYRRERLVLGSLNT
jgi:dimethylamine/trimethylamine dehydrogenase